MSLVSYKSVSLSSEPAEAQSLQEVDSAALALQPGAGDPVSRPLEAPGGHHLPQQDQRYTHTHTLTQHLCCSSHTYCVCATRITFMRLAALNCSQGVLLHLMKQLTCVCEEFVCISAGKMAIPTLWEFFERYLSAAVTRASDWRPLALLLQPLGLSTLRAKTLIRFSGASRTHSSSHNADFFLEIVRKKRQNCDIISNCNT